MLDILESLFWFLLWLVLLVVVHYQFKICIPVTLACMKVAESCALLLLIKIFVLFNIYGNGLSVEIIKNATIEVVKQAKQYATKLEL
mgnify:FL=1